MADQSRTAATRQKLIDAATGTFAADGYLETTPKDIAGATMKTVVPHEVFSCLVEFTHECAGQYWRVQAAGRVA